MGLVAGMHTIDEEMMGLRMEGALQARRPSGKAI
jgi:hypothetical protein